MFTSKLPDSVLDSLSPHLQCSVIYDILFRSAVHSTTESLLQCRRPYSDYLQLLRRSQADNSITQYFILSPTLSVILFVNSVMPTELCGGCGAQFRPGGDLDRHLSRTKASGCMAFSRQRARLRRQADHNIQFSSDPAEPEDADMTDFEYLDSSSDIEMMDRSPRNRTRDLGREKDDGTHKTPSDRSLTPVQDTFDAEWPEVGGELGVSAVSGSSDEDDYDSDDHGDATGSTNGRGRAFRFEQVLDEEEEINDESLSSPGTKRTRSS